MANRDSAGQVVRRTLQHHFPQPWPLAVPTRHQRYRGRRAADQPSDPSLHQEHRILARQTGGRCHGQRQRCNVPALVAAQIIDSLGDRLAPPAACPEGVADHRPHPACNSDPAPPGGAEDPRCFPSSSAWTEVGELVLPPGGRRPVELMFLSDAGHHDVGRRLRPSLVFRVACRLSQVVRAGLQPSDGSPHDPARSVPQATLRTLLERDITSTEVIPDSPWCD